MFQQKMITLITKQKYQKKIHISGRKTTNYWRIKVSTKIGCVFLEIIDELRLASKERYTSPEERQQIINELRLAQQYNNGISKNSKFVRQCIESAI